MRIHHIVLMQQFPAKSYLKVHILQMSRTCKLCIHLQYIYLKNCTVRNPDFSNQNDEGCDAGSAPSSLLFPLLPPPLSISHPNILKELQHLQDIYQDKSILTNCTPSQGPLLCFRGAKHAHCSSRGPPSTIQPQLCPVFLPFPASLPPCIPVWIREWRLFHEASVERQSISYIWWISLDWDKLGSRTKRYALPPPTPPPPPLAPAPSLPYLILQPPLPHPAGERFTQQFSNCATPLSPSLYLSLTSVYLRLSKQRCLSERRELI